MSKQTRRTTKTIPVTAIIRSRIFTRSSIEGEAFAELVRSVERMGGPDQASLVRE